MNFKREINFKQLRCFHAVAEKGSFTLAARTLDVGQPSITTHVKALESYFAVELFCRHGHNVELTETGRALLAITRRIFSLEKDAAELLRAASGLTVGHLKIGAIGPFQVTKMIVAFGQRYPEVELSVLLGNTQDVLNHLLNFRVDVGVLPQEQDDVRFFSIPYGRNRLVVLMSRDYPWTARRVIKLEELEGQRMVLRETGSATRRAFEGALAKAKVKVRKVLEIGSREAVCEAVANGIGLGIALEEESLPDERLQVLTVSNADIYIYPHVVCLRERRNAPLIQAFLGVINDLRAGR